MSIKISELPAATSVGNNDVLPIVQSGTTKKAAASLIKTSISSTINSSSTNDTAAGSKAVYDYSAPISHSTSATTYGVGTASNYGHCKTINNLTTGSYVAGEALSAYQGKVLDDAKEDVANKTNTIDENSTSTQYPNAEATYQAISTLEGNLSAEISNLQAENEQNRNANPSYTATGTSINVKDSSNLPIKDFAILGNATQLTTTGKNLLSIASNDWELGSWGTDGSEVSNNRNARGVPYIACLPNTNYTLSVKQNVTDLRINEYATDKTHILRTTSSNSSSLTITTGATTYYLRWSLNYNNSSTMTQDILDSLNVMLEKSSSTTSYEPYTGGTPAPNPDYPQDIQVVTGDNTLKVLGKNLFDIAVQPMIKSPNYYTYSTQNTTIIGNNVLSNTENQIGWCIPVKNGTNVTISYSSLSYTKGSGSNHQFRLRYAFNDTPITDITTSGLDYTNLISTNSDFTRTDAFTIMASAKYLVLWIGIKSSSTFMLSDLQIEYGSTASTYEAFKSQTQLISLGDIELAKIGTYKDRIYKDNGKWYLEKNVGKLLLNGSETWYVNNTGTPNWFYRKTFTTDLAAANNTLANLYPNVAIGNNDTNQGLCIAPSSSNFIVRIRWGTEDTTTNFQQFLSQNNLILYYPLVTPTTTEITDATLIQQLDNVLAMTTYKNETNAFSIVASGNEEGELQIEYYQDIATLINDLRTAILSL